jgi:large subunit ribosomal protein L10
MSKTKEEKKQVVDEYKTKIQSSKALYFIEPAGITPNEATELKKAFIELDSTFNVVSNTLLKIALQEENIEATEELLTGKNAIIFSSDNVSETAKVIKKFIDDSEKATVKGGLLDGKVLSKEDVLSLASLPSREVLIAQVVGTMNAPISGFVNVLAGNVRSIMNVINAIKDQKENVA